jgi:hypothetical protein
MNKPDDNELHDLIRSKLNDYQPDYQQADWIAMRSKLDHKRRRPFWLLLPVFCLVLGGTTGWLLNNKPAVETNTTIVLTEKTTTHNIRPKIKPTVGTYSIRPKTQTVGTYSIRPKTTTVGTYSIRPKTQTVGTYSIRPKTQTTIYAVTTKTPQIDLKALQIEMDITKQLSTGSFGTDSTAFRVFERNINRWKNTVVVCDFTSSMYPYSTQLYAWLKKNENNPNIKAMVFFTDCDSLGQELQKSKAAGQMFATTNLQFESLLPTMLSAARNTQNNTDDPENDIEALLFAQKQFPTAEHLVLIADNSSAVKGMNQLSKIKKPVHVVLCGTTWDTTVAIQPHHFKIAARTRGSLHTNEDDIQDPNNIEKNTWIRVGSRFYRFRKDEFETTDFQKRPRRFLGLFWF